MADDVGQLAKRETEALKALPLMVRDGHMCHEDLRICARDQITSCEGVHAQLQQRYERDERKLYWVNLVLRFVEVGFCRRAQAALQQRQRLDGTKLRRIRAALKVVGNWMDHEVGWAPGDTDSPAPQPPI